MDVRHAVDHALAKAEIRRDDYVGNLCRQYPQAVIEWTQAFDTERSDHKHGEDSRASGQQ